MVATCNENQTLLPPAKVVKSTLLRHSPSLHTQAGAIQESATKMRNHQPEIGKQYGLVVIQRELPRDKRYNVTVECKCTKCGRITKRRLSEVARGVKTSCLCSDKYKHYETHREKSNGSPAAAVPISIPRVKGGHHDDNPHHRFWIQVDKKSETECWNWKGYKVKGYGKIKMQGKHVFAHRLSFTIHNRQLERGECVLHRCDNPSCVNPNHLFAGTRADNNHDKCAKGRYSKGEDCPLGKLTQEQADYIRANYVKRKTPLIHFARMFGTGTSMIHRIIKNTNYIKTTTPNQNETE